MIIETIGYGESREVLMDNGMHEWLKPSIIARLQDGDNTIECLKTLKGAISDFLSETESVNSKKWYSINNKKHNMLTDEFPNTMIMEMQACTELTKDPNKGLLAFELAIKTKEQKEVYENMFTQLSKNKN
jgi:hypothetical protein